MKNKCPKCGFEYGEFDLFCARCGSKLSQENNVEPDNNLEDKKSSSDFKLFFKERKKTEFFDSSKVNFFDSVAFNLVICMIVAFIILVGVMYFAINKHTNYKNELYYKNDFHFYYTGLNYQFVFLAH